MLKIGAQQLLHFAQVAVEQFETRMLAHLHSFFPEQYDTLGEQGGRELIQLGIHRAGIYGLVAEKDVCKFIDIMVIFGPDFDLRETWAQDILKNSSFSNPSIKARILCQAAIEREPVMRRNEKE